MKHADEEFDLTEEMDDAVAAAKVRARAVIDQGGEAEVLVANVLGMWDKVELD